MIRGFEEFDSGGFGQPGGHEFAELGMSVDAGAHGGAADGQVFRHAHHGPFGPAHGIFRLSRVAAEFLTHANGGGVHEVGAADFDQVIPLAGFGFEGFREMFKGGDEAILDSDRSGNLHGGGEGVVGGLAHVDMIVGVDGVFRSDLAADFLAGEVGDNLVDIHVGGGAGAGLENIDGEVLHHGRQAVDFAFHGLALR